MPKYALMKTCPRVEDEDFSFHPAIYEEKVYSKVIGGVLRDIRVTNYNDDALITTLTGHTARVWRLKIYDGKLYSASWDRTIKIWNCSTDILIKTLIGHTRPVKCLTISDGTL